MSVAIVHYHLRTGGVTKVIETTSAALTAENVPHVILIGEMPASDHLPVVAVEGLGYGAVAGGEEDDAGELAIRMRAAAVRALGRPPDVWHFHNHALGKNPLTARVVDRFARDGEAMVLQCHDFVEDGRAENLPMLQGLARLYPVGPRIHYGLLNSEDRITLTGCGLPPERADVLPNPIIVRSPALPSPDPVGPAVVFYPVRAIPRKNIGELLLLAALSPAGTRYAISRAPDNPAWLESHREWRRFAEEAGLPVDFEVVDRLPPPGGVDASFESWLRAASHFVSTSLAEGFGMVFLEAAAEGRPLFGRDLPRVTRDHAAAGLRVGRLYRALSVAGAGTPDFGTMATAGQRAAIRRVLEDPAAAAAVTVRTDGIDRAAAGWLATALRQRESDIRPWQLAAFSPFACAARLQTIYRNIATAAATQDVSFLDREAVHQAFQRRGDGAFAVGGTWQSAAAD